MFIVPDAPFPAGGKDPSYPVWNLQEPVVCRMAGAVSRAHRHSPEPATLLLAPLAGGVLGQEEMASVQEGNASVLPSDCTLKFVF